MAAQTDVEICRMYTTTLRLRKVGPQNVCCSTLDLFNWTNRVTYFVVSQKKHFFLMLSIHSLMISFKKLNVTPMTFLPRFSMKRSMCELNRDKNESEGYDAHANCNTNSAIRDPDEQIKRPIS